MLFSTEVVIISSGSLCKLFVFKITGLTADDWVSSGTVDNNFENVQKGIVYAMKKKLKFLNFIWNLEEVTGTSLREVSEFCINQ